MVPIANLFLCPNFIFNPSLHGAKTKMEQLIKKEGTTIGGTFAFEDYGVDGFSRKSIFGKLLLH